VVLDTATCSPWPGHGGKLPKTRLSRHYGVTSILPVTRTVRQLHCEGVVELRLPSPFRHFVRAGPCDVSNVVGINSEVRSQWLRNITHLNQYRLLVEWAVRSVEAGHLLELPSEFKDDLLEPWR
jgi:hypothetical protein